MWIEFDNLWTLEGKVKSAAFQLKDVMDSLEKSLRGGAIPYRKVDHMILVDQAVFDKYPDARAVFDAHQVVYKSILDSLNIVEELPYRHGTIEKSKNIKE